MWPIRLPIEVERIDCPFTFLHVDFFFRHLLSVQRYELIDASNAEVVAEFLVDLATVRLVNSYIANGFFVEIRFLLQSSQKVRNGSIPGYQNLKGLLKCGLASVS